MLGGPIKGYTTNLVQGLFTGLGFRACIGRMEK